MQAQRFQMIAKTLKSLEGILAEELQNIDAEEIEVGTRMVSFWGDKSTLYKANLRLRTALRILKPIHNFRATSPEALYEELVRYDWSRVMTSSHTFSVDTTVYSDTFTHSKYVGYKTKDAIVDYFRQREGRRPSVSLDKPDIYINVHIAHTEVTISLDSSGESLHKRGYKEYQTEASINEVLAAGILLMAGWKGQSDLLDPMCGSGTFLIEAALIARNIAPGIYRTSFAFEKWMDFDEGLFRSIYEDDSQERDFVHTIYGSDILRDAIRISGRNVERAGMNKHIMLEYASFQSLPKPTTPLLLVMNPPYGERLQLSAVEAFYSMVGERLKHNYAGSQAWIIAYKPEHFNSIGLRPSSRLEVCNGSLDCEIRSFDLFDGKREAFKARTREDRPTKTQRSSPFVRAERPHRDSIRADRTSKVNKNGFERRKSQASDRPFRTGRTELEAQGEKRETKKPQGFWPRDRFKTLNRDGQRPQHSRRPVQLQIYRSDDDQ